MKSALNIAVIGCGYWGPNLIRNFKSLSGSCVKLICDRDQERLAHMKQLYPDIQTTTDFGSVVKNTEIDAVAIATPVRSHFEFAKQSLLAGKHILIEKPMAASVAQCYELIELAERQKLIIMVGHTFIYSSAVRKVKEILNSGRLGKIFYISSQRLNLGLFQKDVNVTWDLAPHDISIILYLLEQNPVAVNCRGKAHLAKGIEDIATIALEFPDNGFAIIHNSWLDPNKVRKMTIVGSKGMIIYDDVEPLEKIKIYDKRVELPPYYDTFAEFQYSYHYGDMSAPYIKQMEPLRAQCQHFLDCIKTETKPESSGLEGLKVVQILELASESLKKDGAKIEIIE
jgi:predicted dehydrogenase